VAPILLIGHSLGGVFAREIGIHLNVNGSPHNPFVFMFDSWAIGQNEICPEKAGQFVAVSPIRKLKQFSFQGTILPIFAKSEESVGIWRTKIGSLLSRPSIYFFQKGNVARSLAFPCHSPFKIAFQVILF
jgi:hypothetical protein